MDNKPIKIENKSITPFERQINSYIDVALKPAIITYSPVDAQNNIMATVAYAVTISGQKVLAPEMKIIADEIHERCSKLYPNVTLEEIRTAVKNGIYEEYGEYYGINAKFIMFFIESYLKSESRRLAKEEHEKAKRLEPIEIPKMTIRQWKESIMRDYNLMKNGDSNLIVFTAKKYILLRRLGILGLKSLESWQVWLLRAKERRTWVSSQDARLTGEKGLFSEMQKIYSKFDETGELPMSEFKQLVREARKLRYFRFLEAMVRKGIDDFFNDKPNGL